MENPCKLSESFFKDMDLDLIQQTQAECYEGAALFTQRLSPKIISDKSGEDLTLSLQDLC